MADSLAQKSGSLRDARRQEALELRRSDVLRAALAVFAEKGFAGANMGEVASRAEVSLASLYALFASKDRLFEEVIRTSTEAMRSQVEERLAGVREGRERVLALVDAIFACSVENGELLRIYSHATHGISFKVRQELGDSAVEHLRGFGHWVIDIVRRAAPGGGLRGLDPEALALSLIGAVVMTATHSVEQTPPRSPAHHAAAVRAIFAKAIGVEGS